MRIEIVDAIDSTNREVKEWAAAGRAEGAVLFAERQSAGRGRLGRSFFSPAGSGLYFSILLRPQGAAADALRLTIAAGVAVAEAIERELGLAPKIKWVNDLYLGDRKVCGILAEGAPDDKGGLTYCVLGIGLNVYAPAEGFGALSEIAGALLEGAPDAAVRNRLAEAILERFFARYRALNDPDIMEAYRSRSYLQGKQVAAVRGGERLEGVVAGIDEAGALLLQTAEGDMIALQSGEVQLEKYR